MKCHTKKCSAEAIYFTKVGTEVWGFCEGHHYLYEVNEELINFLKTEHFDNLIKEAMAFAKHVKRNDSLRRKR